MLLQEQENNARPNYFKYVKGELHLVLIKNPNSDEATWTYRQDVKDDTPILRSKIYTFGNRYGILSKKEDNNSKLNIQGLEWHLKTLPNGLPILRNSATLEADKKCPRYLRLDEVV
jgi:hypothetical protein